MWKVFSNFFKPEASSEPKKKTYVLDLKPDLGPVRSIWRNNMWIMTPDGVGIVFDLREPVRVHLVDANGITVGDKEYSSLSLRQAKYLEIPESRRGDPTKAKRLGYE